MLKPMLPKNEGDRLKALASYQILDSLPEQTFEDITLIATQICGTPVSLISLIDEKRQWFKSNRGLGDTRETSRDYAYCAHAINEPASIMEVEDAFEDVRFKDNPLATGEPHVRFYAGSPLVDENGFVLGTLCVIDHKPRKLSSKQKESLKALSRQVMALLKMRQENFEKISLQGEYSALLANLGDGVFELDANGLCNYANPAMLQMLDLSLDQVIGKNIWQFINDGDQPAMKTYYAQCFSNKVTSCSYKYRLNNAAGKLIWVNHKSTMSYSGKRMIKLRSIARNITQETVLAEKLEDNESLYRLVSENSTDLIAIHHLDGSYKYISPSVNELLGYSQEEMIGQDPYEYIHSEDIKKLKKGSHKKAAKGESESQIQYRMRQKNGAYLWLESNTKPIFEKDGTVGSFQTSSRDITNRKLEREQILKYKEGLTILNELSSQSKAINELIKEALKKLSDFFSMSYAWISQSDNLTSEVLYAYEDNNNYAFFKKKIIHKSKDFGSAVIDKNEVCQIYNASKFAEKDKPFFTDQTFNSYLGAPINVNGLKMGSISFANIETIERPFSIYDNEFMILICNWIGSVFEKNLKDEDLKKAKNYAEQASSAKANFLSMMSHEIRTPLNGIIGTTYLLLNKSPTPEQLNLLNILKISGNNLLALVNDILDFSKIEEGKLTLESTNFNLHELAENIHANYRIQALNQGVDVLLFWDSSLSDGYVGDPIRISQILHNLINNATKFTSQGEVKILITLTNQHDDFDEIKFRIRDTGIGISQDKIKDIFENFNQADLSTTRKFGGSGLGLAITKLLIEKMDSEINVTSELGKGSEFNFTLVLKRSELTPDTEPEVETYANLSAKILLVEDNLFNRAIAKDFLESWGCTVVETSNGKEALEEIRKSYFDLVLLDLQMPIMDGYETIKEIRKSPLTKDLRVVALTASALGDIRERVFKAGMNGYVTKPFHPQELYKKVEENIKQNRTLADQLPQLSLKKLTNLIGDDQPTIEKFLNIFISSMRNDMIQLSKEIELVNVQSIKSFAHKNKSSLKSMGFDELAEEAIEIEKMIDMGNPNDMVIDKAKVYLRRLEALIITLSNR